MCVIVTNIFTAIGPWILKVAIDDLNNDISVRKITYYALLLLGVAIIAGVFLFAMRLILIGMSRWVEYDLRNDFFAHLQKLHPQFYDVTKTGDLMALATNDLNAVRMVLGPGVMYMINTCFSTIMILSYLVRLDWVLTLWALLPFPIMTVLVYYLVGLIHPRFEAIQAQFATITSRVQENLAGVRVIKAYTREESELSHFDKLNQEYIRRNLSLVLIQGLLWPLMSTLFGVGLVIVLWIGGARVIEGYTTIGTLAAFMSYLAMLFWPVISMGWILNLYQRGDASMSRINKIFRTAPAIMDTLDTLDMAEIRGTIEFKNLTFAYRPDSDPVLRQINITIRQGMTLAIVGRTGSGKSTLVNLICRLYDPPRDQIFIDGRNLQRIPIALLRKNIGYVPQETFLFSDTIAENIRFGVQDIPSEQIVQAAKMARVHEEIMDFPNKYDTLLGERGINLSGGQKQRIAIARALIREPKILILDNSLSHVDTQTEEYILHHLYEVMKERTSIIVSDRISTIKHADQIIVLDHGEIIERGSHHSLVEQGGTYAGLYQKQLLSEELEID